MISKKHRCVFVHVPKTGGQSVESFFLSLHGLDWESREALLLRPNDNPAEGPQRLAHLYAQEYTRLGYLSEQEFSSYFKFSFVRNPWSRLVSEYKFRSYGNSYSFSEFVESHLPEANDYLDTYRHVVPQVDYLYDGQGGLLVDFVGRFETLQRDFDRVCEQLGLSETTLPYRNASASGGRFSAVRSLLARVLSGGEKKTSQSESRYTDYYDKRTRDLVAKIYQRDIEAFDYQYGQ